MMATLDWLSDNLIELRGPVNVATNLPINNTATVTAKLYDTAKDARVGSFETILAADTVPTTLLIVRDLTPIAVGASLLIQMDNGVTHAGAVVAVTPPDSLFISPATPSAASKGARVRLVQLPSISTLITLDDWSEWVQGDNMEITTTAGTLIERVISLLNPDGNYVTLASSLGNTVNTGAQIKRKIGANITLSAFGSFPASNPVVGDPAWGFRGTINHDHADILPGMRIRGEITAVDGTLNLSRKAIATVINT